MSCFLSTFESHASVAVALASQDECYIHVCMYNSFQCSLLVIPVCCVTWQYHNAVTGGTTNTY